MRVWFIATEKDSGDQDSLRRIAENAADDLPFATRRSSLERVLGGDEKDRPYRALSPRDARDIYRDAHVRRCLILTTHRCHVKADASHSPSTLREMLKLEEFLAYKADFALIRSAADAKQAVADFRAWPTTGSCLDHHDPRVLPLHVFDPETAWLNLHSAEERVAFDRRYQRKAGIRRDGSARAWQQPNGLHGTAGAERSTLAVADHVLNPGYHWDVQRGRGKARLVSECEVWLLERENAYLNVYPNAYIRGERQYGARRVWPK